MFGDKRRQQQYDDHQRRQSERALNTVMSWAAAVTGLRLTMRTDTWRHLCGRPALAELLAAVAASRIDGDPADLGATVTVALAAPQLAHLVAALHADKGATDRTPADLAARAVALHLYPALVDAVHTAVAASGVPTVVLDGPADARALTRR
ncbi:hypothetical protein [Kitasatospora griseola]|uniref:hypothetical protein n=1 Tax=Kitasatospora griseola TaxID=2064 RepID=UPI00166FE663|nr:hypothetical protein [Kitasatospora griseola]GGR04291.1 hypothetical protein GCM10010195_69720 [Kitasatospora griseola]